MSANITLIGRIGKLGELKITANHTKHLGFTMATSRWKPGRDGAEGTETTTWWHCRIFGARAESVAKRLSIGDLVEVRGETWQEPWTATDGSQRSTLEVSADNVQRLMPGRNAATKPAATEQADTAVNVPAEIKPDPTLNDPPF